MKTGNTLRTAKNSLLCFFMALAGGFLVACGSSSDGVGSPTPRLAAPATPTLNVDPMDPPSFRAYLVDTAVQGVSVSGPTGDGVTGEGGVFKASDGEFVFSIGGTTLGSVQMSRNQADNEVTPSDFIGVDLDASVAITIARILQALDADASDPGLQNGISISQATRDDQDGASALKDAAGNTNDEMGNVGGVIKYTLPSVGDATKHLVATRQCLFSGGYVGDYLVTARSDGGEPGEEGQVYYAVEPFANRARRFGFTDDVGALKSFDPTSAVGVTGSEIVLTVGNTLSFTTPRSVAGVWERMEGTVTVSGTHNLIAVAGNPGANRRIVGVETTANTATVTGMYVLDHFENDDGVFSGQYYSVNDGTVSASPLTLTIATGDSWLDSTADMGAETTLELIGTRGEEGTTITMGIIRGSATDADENYGTFFDGSKASDAADGLLSGTWCDIGGAVGSTEAPTPPEPSNAPNADTVIEITWDAVPGATVYNLYRSTVSGVTVETPIATIAAADGVATLTRSDNRPSADTEYFYQLEACNSAGCSERSDVVPTNPPQDPPAVALVGSAQGEIEADWGVKSLAMSHSRIGGDVSAHRLSRYLDSGIDGVQILG